MALTTRIAQPGELGFDTNMVLSDANASDLVAAGFTFAVRYVDTITAAELERLTAAGLGVMPTGNACTHAGALKWGARMASASPPRPWPSGFLRR
jgi:hypothetical protein